MTARGSIGRGAPRLATVTALRSPFEFIPTAELPTSHREYLEFDIPSDRMRMSEARAWADSQALQWATERLTTIVGTIDWRVDGMTIGCLVTLTSPPRKPKRVYRKATP